MGEKEDEFRKQISVASNDKSSMPDKRSAQQRAIDGLGKMTPKNLETIMNPGNTSDVNIRYWARHIWNHYTPSAKEGEQESYECDRDGE